MNIESLFRHMQMYYLHKDDNFEKHLNSIITWENVTLANILGGSMRRGSMRKPETRWKMVL